MAEPQDPLREGPPSYIIFLVVFLFFLTGLLGFLICHLLKKKGYRCRTADMEEDEEEDLGGSSDEEHEENQDTVEKILKTIVENEANMEAFNEMLGNRSVCVRHDPRLRKDSIAGIPAHHHTVHSGMEHNSCLLCAKRGRRASRTPRLKQRAGEQTVFSVGRFRVTHSEKKVQVGQVPTGISEEHLEQRRGSEGTKESGYNLRSMFKDARAPTESPNGTAPLGDKRRKSLTMFGLRRGSDPVGVKVTVGSSREAGAGKRMSQQKPALDEEPVQMEKTETTTSTLPPK